MAELDGSAEAGELVTDHHNEAILRLSGRYLLDQVTVVRFAFGLLDALIVVAVTQANVAPISADRALQRRYATYEDVPPEDVRRPISINAVAQSLGLPFETVRRHVIKLSLLGVLKMSRDGVCTSQSTVHGTQYRQGAEVGYARLQTLQRELDSFGWLEVHAADEIVWRGPTPLRLVARISTDYLLRLIHALMDVAGDPVGAMIWLGLFCEEPASGREVRVGSSTSVSAAALSRTLRLSPETTRRRLDALAAAGLCVRDRNGARIDAETLASPSIARLMSRNRQDLKRMLTALAEFGILQAWREPHSAAA